MTSAKMLYSLLGALLAGMIACTMLCAWSLYEVHQQLVDFPAHADLAIANLTAHVDNRLDSIETDADAQITQLRVQTLQRVDNIERDANGQMTALLSDADSQITGIRGDTAIHVNDTLARVDTALTQTATIATATAATLKPVQEASVQIDEALPYIINCDPSYAGADCLPNKYLEITHSANTAFFAVAQASPAIAKDVHGIADDAKQAADKFVAPPTKWEKVKAFAVLIGTILAKGLM
jgi:hypothetical protein